MTDIDKKKEININFDKLHHILWDFYINNYPETIDLVELRIKYYELPIRELLDQNNKAWLKRVKGLKMNNCSDTDTRFECGFNSSVSRINKSIDNIVNKFKEGKE